MVKIISTTDNGFLFLSLQILNFKILLFQKVVICISAKLAFKSATLRVKDFKHKNYIACLVSKSAEK